MKCEICDQGPFQGVSVFRVGPTGKPTKQWRCEAHLPSKNRNEKEIAIVNAIESENKTKH